MIGLGFDAGAEQEGAMASRKPTQNEQWVACAMANDAIEKLCIDLVVEFASYIAPTRDNPGPSAREIIDRLLGGPANNATLLNWTDLDPAADFDMDVAKHVALEMIEDQVQSIRKTALNER